MQGGEEMADTKPRRRFRLSYSLRALLVLTTIVAIWCAFHANRGRYERSVERELVALGGRVLVGKYDPTTVKTIAPSSYQRFLMRLFGERFIVGIEITGNTLPDAKLPEGLVDRALALPHLASFTARQCNVRDDDLRNLARARGLQALSLPDNPVTDEGLSGLVHLIELKHLDLQGTAIGDETLFRLPQMPQLVSVTLNRTDVTGKGMPPFAPTARLQAFWAEQTMLCDDFLVALAQCKSVKSDLLEQCAFTDAGVTALSNHPGLEMVFLAGNKELTDRSLVALASLPRLKRVGMAHSKYTRDGVRTFRDKRPDVDL
jgi:hypothetical protein